MGMGGAPGLVMGVGEEGGQLTPHEGERRGVGSPAVTLQCCSWRLRPPLPAPPGRPASVLRQSIGRRAGRGGSVAGPAFLTVATQRHWRRVAAWVAPATVVMVTSRRFDTATLNGLLMQRR